MFRELNTNSDAQARGLAKELMDRADLLPEVDNSHLEALPREYGKDLTSGKIERRQREIDLNMSLPKSTDKGNVAK